MSVHEVIVGKVTVMSKYATRSAIFGLLVYLLYVGMPPLFGAIEHPNVLLICVDDLRPVLGCYGGAAKTPNLDRFSKSAVTFQRHYVGQLTSVISHQNAFRMRETSFFWEDWRNGST